MPHPPSSRREWGLDLGVLTLVVGAFSLAAVRAFPQMDDAYLLLLLKEQGAASIAAAHPDRPLVGALWQAMASALGPAFWPAGFVSHFILWLTLGVVTCRLWRRVFPQWAAYAPVAGALSVAPILVRTQLSTVTITLLGVLSVVAAYGALAAVFRFLGGRRPAFLVLAAALVLAAGVLSEYGVVAAVAAAVLLYGLPVAGSDRRVARAAAAALVVLSVAAYLGYIAVGDFSRRPLVDPRQRLGAAHLLLAAPFNVLTRFWDATFGELARSVGNFDPQWSSKSSLAALAAGGLMAAALLLAIRWGAVEGANEDEPSGRRSLAAFAGALGAGLVPVALMRPVYRSPFASRFYLPILPVAASLTVGLVLTVLRPRFRPHAVALMGLLIGLAVFQESARAIRTRQAMAVTGALLKPLVLSASGSLLFAVSDDALCHTAQVCTGAITADWPPELTRRVWIEKPTEAFTSLGSRASCGPLAVVGLAERGFRRSDFDPNPRWIELAAGKSSIEPYCVSERIGGGAASATPPSAQAVERHP